MLLYGNRLEENKQLLEDILEKHTPAEILRTSAELREDKFLQLIPYVCNQADKMLLLINLAESDNSQASKLAMKTLEKELANAHKIIEPKYFVKVIKYIAIHSEKQYSKIAIKFLSNILPEIANLDNPELKASTLRYLATHGSKYIQRKSYLLLEKLSDIDVRENSLDYLRERNRN